jgi:hypothetical protein
MKNDIRDYKGLSKEDKEYLKEFDKAIQREIFDDNHIKMPVKMKKLIVEERNLFRRDLMFVNKRGGGDIDKIHMNNKPYVGRKKVDSARDETGKFIKKDKK